MRVGLAIRVPAGSVRVNKEKGTVNGRRYRGELKVVPAGKGRVTVVNVLPMEDYVRGVVASEMSHGWPLEALKSQAVVARSYAVANKGRYASDGFDLCATPACQVYGGISAERPATDKAVASTRGQVLMYKGEPISAVFHSCCGGETDDAKDVWRSKGVPYLKGVRGRWCRRGSPHHQWKAEISEETLAAAMRSAGHDVGSRIRSIRIVSRTGAGRAYEVRVTGDERGATLQANAFRLIVGSRLLKSTWWSGVSSDGGKWRFHGQGWGHGVGLCQWCAKMTADQGYKYKEILTYFYRHAKVKEL
jgi:stage II sporulation protein D